ncbi:MAG: twin-arginine translocase subunit TatC [Verrucomicrobiae bacterium]|nr:twin-arginine translocase subunit TatC [Verrucomicrobiae bacterium]
MAPEREDARVQLDAEENGGGPVKPFLEHLEDLRWVLLKCLAAVAVAFVVCLLGGNFIVRLLTYPLKTAPAFFTRDTRAVTLIFGTNRLGTFELAPEEYAKLGLGTGPVAVLKLEPTVIGTNQVLGWRLCPEASAAARRGLQVELVTLSPVGAFVVALKVAAYAGVVLAAPFVLFFVGQFVFPALTRRERYYASRALVIGGGLFIVGVLFCYFVLVPIALTASVQYAQWLGFATPQWRAEDYVAFVSKFMLGMGLGFELPVVVLALVKIGVLDYRTLARARRYVIVINLIIGAVLTPPDVFTQVLMAVPLQLLYELTVWIAWFWARKERRMRERADALAHPPAG